MFETGRRALRTATGTAVVPVVLLVCLSAAIAASGATDPAHDTQSCTGECSAYDQDLKSIALSKSGANLLITVSQYGPGAGSCVSPSCAGPFTSAQKLYWPHVDLYTTSPNPTTPPDWPWLSTTRVPDYEVLDGYSCSSTPCTYVMQLARFNPVTHAQQVIKIPLQYALPNPNTITYVVPLNLIGNPTGCIRARAWQGGTSDPGSHRIVDQVPNGTGVVGCAGGGGGSFGSGARVVFTSSTAQVRGGVATIALHNKNSFAVRGLLTLTASPGPAGDFAAAARSARFGSKSFKLGAGKTVKVKVKLSAKALGALAKNGKLKALATAVLRDPQGHKRTIKRTITLTLAH